MTEFDKATFDAQKNIPSDKISDVETKAIIELPAIYANKFYLANSEASMIRLVFTDETPGKNHIVPRASIIMSINAFMSLTQMLYNVANNIRQQVEQEAHLKNMIAENSFNKNNPPREDLNK